ncbi:hypothetical protein GCM10019016_103320 [Streptomyces prasinosporus]|uniref:Uncharacterized protein n=1 Tax=Streptomyces prasinosporus TaxID=68256 RepID=A0ABP6U6N3_9ACTN
MTARRPSRTGGRKVTRHQRGRDKSLGTAYSDHDLDVLLEIADATAPCHPGRPAAGEWHGSRTHTFTTARVRTRVRPGVPWGRCAPC